LTTPNVMVLVGIVEVVMEKLELTGGMLPVSIY
jgi:hypothetical protein